MLNEAYKRILSQNQREDQSDKLFVSRKMGPVMAACNGTIASCLKETLTLGYIRASGRSTRKQLPLMQPVKEPLLEQSWKLVTGLTLPQYTGTTSDAYQGRFNKNFGGDIN